MASNRSAVLPRSLMWTVPTVRVVRPRPTRQNGPAVPGRWEAPKRSSWLVAGVGFDHPLGYASAFGRLASISDPRERSAFARFRWTWPARPSTFGRLASISDSRERSAFARFRWTCPARPSTFGRLASLSVLTPDGLAPLVHRRLAGSLRSATLANAPRSLASDGRAQHAHRRSDDSLRSPSSLPMDSLRSSIDVWPVRSAHRPTHRCGYAAPSFGLPAELPMDSLRSSIDVRALRCAQRPNRRCLSA